MKLQNLVFLFLILFQISLFAQESLPKTKILSNSEAPETTTRDPFWEYGVGVGFVRFEQYPAAGTYSQLFLPFPAFQYRGRTVRADDREGAKAYLWKEGNWSLEMSGTGSPPLDSGDNSKRKGMDDLLLILAIGPQLVYQISDGLNFGLGVYQAVATDFQMTRFSGAFFESKMTYTTQRILKNQAKLLTKYFLTLKSTTQEIQDQYYSVGPKDVTADRPAFHARAGFLDAEISIYQSYKKGRMSFYVGGNYTNYSFSKNKKSPLHLADSQVNYLFGMIYSLGESNRPEVNEDQTSGILNQK